MADEAVIIELIESGVPIRYTCAEDATILKGTLGKITDPRTLIASSADNDPFAGVVSMEKVADDGSTHVSAYTKGIFDIKGSAAIAIGERVSLSGANTVTKTAAADVLFADVGIALEATVGAGTLAVFVGFGD